MEKELLPQIEIELIARETESRSRQFQCELTIRNNTDAVINVHEIALRAPPSADIQKAENVSMTVVEEYKECCEVLSETIIAIMNVSSKDFRKQFYKEMVEVLKEIITSKSFFLIYAGIIYNPFRKMLDKKLEKFHRQRMLSVNISNSNDAKRVFDKLKIEFVSNQNPASIAWVKPLLFSVEEKIERLSEIERKNDRISSGIVAASLAPQREFSTIYIIDCRRRMFSSTQYTISADVSVSGDSSAFKDDQLLTKSIALTISPSPVALSIIAIFSSFVGTTIAKITSQTFYTTEIKNIAFYYVLSSMTALIFYNTFEFTTYKDIVGRQGSWRLALFLGALCGLMNERIVASLTAFVKG